MLASSPSPSSLPSKSSSTALSYYNSNALYIEIDTDLSTPIYDLSYHVSSFIFTHLPSIPDVSQVLPVLQREIVVIIVSGTS